MESTWLVYFVCYFKDYPFYNNSTANFCHNLQSTTFTVDAPKGQLVSPTALAASQFSPLYSAHYKVNAAHCILQTAQWKLYTAQWSLYTAQSTLHIHTAHCTLHTAHCTWHTVHCTLDKLDTAHCTLQLHTLHCAMHTAHKAIIFYAAASECIFLIKSGLLSAESIFHERQGLS